MALAICERNCRFTSYIYYFFPLNFFLRKLCETSMHALALGLYGDENECLIPNWVTTFEYSEFLIHFPYLTESFDFL